MRGFLCRTGEPPGEPPHEALQANAIRAGHGFLPDGPTAARRSNCCPTLRSQPDARRSGVGIGASEACRRAGPTCALSCGWSPGSSLRTLLFATRAAPLPPFGGALPAQVYEAHRFPMKQSRARARSLPASKGEGCAFAGGREI